MKQQILMSQKAYPSEKVLLWAITAQEIKECIKKGNIPQIVLPDLPPQNKPKIAIILAQDQHPDREEKDYTVFPDYVDAVLRFGGYPVFIAYDQVEEQLEAVSPDGVLLLGGNFRLIKRQGTDYEPRPKAYVVMMEYARKHRLPLFAICGGEQMLAVYYGAGVRLDLNDASQKYDGHMQPPYTTSHWVLLSKQSQIRQILGKHFLKVNSCHKTAVVIDEDNPDIMASALSDDGVVEAVELRNPWNPDFVIGVQWHPERLSRIGDTASLKLFEAFVGASSKRKESGR